MINTKNILENDNKHILENLGPNINKLKKSRVLVTGSKGFLGSTIISFLNHINKTIFTKKERLEIIAIDYEDHDICKSMLDISPEGNIDYIINCAGIASPKKYLKAPVKTLDVSYLGTKNIFNLAKLKNTKSVLMFSSSEVYGTPPAENIPTKEDFVGSVTTFGNRSCYDIGKNVLETLSYVYYDTYQVPVNVLRPFNLYGPLMDLNDGRIIPNICKSMMEGKEFSVYGNGEQTRTYCYVADAMVYIMSVLLEENFGEIYNIGSDGDEMSALQIATRAYSINQNHESEFVCKPYPGDYPHDEPRRRCPDISKVKQKTGYTPQYSFEQGFKSCYQHFLNNQENNSV